MVKVVVAMVMVKPCTWCYFDRADFMVIVVAHGNS